MRRPERHELVWLSRTGWERLHGRAAAADAELLAHWATHDLPVVATRRVPGLPADELALGLPSPRRWEGRRLALAARCDEVARLGQFPKLPDVVAGLPTELARPLADIAAALGEHAESVRVYGSHGWQLLSGLDCLRPGSDVDLLLPAADASTADTLCRRLAECVVLLRVDGELLLPEGRAVAWREWLRAAPGAPLLVKHLDGAELLRRDALWPQALAA